jgi:hypothetical protein
MLPAIMLVGPFWLRPCISIGGSGVTTTLRLPPRFGSGACAPAGIAARASATRAILELHLRMAVFLC